MSLTIRARKFYRRMVVSPQEAIDYLNKGSKATGTETWWLKPKLAIYRLKNRHNIVITFKLDLAGDISLHIASNTNSIYECRAEIAFKDRHKIAPYLHNRIGESWALK